jgi:hypothetical protein
MKRNAEMLRARRKTGSKISSRKKSREHGQKKEKKFEVILFFRPHARLFAAQFLFISAICVNQKTARHL